jgi:hypothetical protein
MKHGRKNQLDAEFSMAGFSSHGFVSDGSTVLMLIFVNLYRAGPVWRGIVAETINFSWHSNMAESVGLQHHGMAFGDRPL